jgi:hypothetical protein
MLSVKPTMADEQSISRVFSAELFTLAVARTYLGHAGFWLLSFSRGHLYVLILDFPRRPSQYFRVRVCSPLITCLAG